MKDVNPAREASDTDTANGNSSDASCVKVEESKEDVNKNEMASQNPENVDNEAASDVTQDMSQEEASHENGNEDGAKKQEEAKPETNKFVPKYNYSSDQWSPINTSGKKCYDLNLLKQIKDDPLSKDKPDIPKLDQCNANIIRSSPFADPFSLSNLASMRPTSDALFPNFIKMPGGAPKNMSRDGKREGRNNIPSGKSSAKLTSSPSMNSPMKPNVIRMSLSLREDVKLNETENAWRPTRFKKDNLTEEERKTQELYKKFTGILNKLTPQKFDTLLEKVKTLPIDTQSRMEGVIDLVFEKAIDEPNFSEAYANMCSKLSLLKVPSNHSPDQCVNFRALILNRCQAQFVTKKVDESVEKLQKEMAECTDPAKKKELTLMLAEENRRVRMRSVGNVRFIGELYKLKMLKSKIMVYCMNYLIEELEEEKLECLCKLLTTIGQQVEIELKAELDEVFKKMQRIVSQKSNKISSRVRFMLIDVIELRRRQWVPKSVIDLQPRMMDQIQKEAEQQHRQTELLNSSMGSSVGYGRRDEGGRSKRGAGDVRRQQNVIFDNSNNWKTTKTKYPFDASKFKAVSNNKTLDNIKLAPSRTAWSQGWGTKSASTTSPIVNLPSTTNKFSILEDIQTDAPTQKAVDTPGYYSKGASIERSTFNFPSSTSGNRSGSAGVPRNNNEARPSAPRTPAPHVEVAPVAQVAINEQQQNLVKSIIEQSILTPDDNELVEEIKLRFKPEHHSSVVAAIFNSVIEKPTKDIIVISKSLTHLIATNTISARNFVTGLDDIFEIAPDLYIDIPMLYNNLGILIVPHIEKKHISLADIFKLSSAIIAANQGQLFLKAIIKDLKTSMGPSFVKSKWRESGLQVKQWMEEDQVPKFISEFEFLEGEAQQEEESPKTVNPAEARTKLLQLMIGEENSECIRGWIKDNIGKSSNEEPFLRSLTQAIFEYALFDPKSKGEPYFNPDRASKYFELLQEFGTSRSTMEASCLFGIQQLIHQLEHPQGLTLKIFQYLHEQYLISLDGFTAWEESELEPEGKGVMLKALTSFFTNIKEADNEDSLSED